MTAAVLLFAGAANAAEMAPGNTLQAVDFASLPGNKAQITLTGDDFSFILAPAPALLMARALGRRSILNYRSGEADDHLTRWKRTAVPGCRLADRIIVGSGYLIEVFARHGLEAPLGGFVTRSAPSSGWCSAR